MTGLGRVAFGSCLWLVAGCGQSPSDEPLAGSDRAGSPAVSSAGAVASAKAGSGTGGSAGGELADPVSRGGSSEPAGGVSAAAAGEGGVSTIDNPPGLSELQLILDTYHTYAPQTPEPVSVSGYLFGICRAPTLRETEFLNSIHGDGRYLQDWANPLAAQALASEQPATFPAGSVIVKEKYAGPVSVKPDLVAIGLMIKRSAGFDTARGDWDYAYYEPALGIVQTAEQSAYCANCHAGAAATDFVYVDGLKP